VFNIYVWKKLVPNLHKAESGSGIRRFEKSYKDPDPEKSRPNPQH
jgi:hypothetical protein